MAEMHGAGGEWLNAGEKLDQRRFARPVHSDQRNAISALYRELNVAENFLFAIALRYARAFDDQSAAGFGLWKTEVDGLLVRGDLDAVDFLEFLDAALHLLRLGRLRAKAVDKCFKLLDAFALVLVRRHQGVTALLFLMQILLVIAAVKLHALVPYFDDAIHRYVEEIAVVRDQQIRVGILQEILLQPVAGFEIEMVGGLVEKQQVGFGQ